MTCGLYISTWLQSVYCIHYCSGVNNVNSLNGQDLALQTALFLSTPSIGVLYTNYY